MMNGSDILELFRTQLVGTISELADGIPPFQPLDIDPWLAMSLMQKAIRRGREDLALGAAATLAKKSPDKLWRRLCVTAYEDIGVANFDLVALVTVALKGKKFRSNLGGEWSVASFLIQSMCRSNKCRAVDDLAVVCELENDLEPFRLELACAPLPSLIERATWLGDIGERAIALWYALGTERCRSTFLQLRRGCPQATFDILCEFGYPETVVEICREGLRKINEVLPPLLVLLEKDARDISLESAPDELPDEVLIRDIPCWAYDMHVRDGNRAISSFLEGKNNMANWAKRNIGERRRVSVVGSLLFRVESGLVDRRSRWETSKSLRERADVCFGGLPPNLAREGMAILQAELPRLNDARRHVVRRKSN